MNPLPWALAGLLAVPPVPLPVELPAASREVVLVRDLAPRTAGSDSDSPSVRPVPGAVVHGFDPPEQAWSSGHRGVDLAAVPGETVRSALSGVVTFAGPLAGRGVVVVDHGGRRTTYEPVLSWVDVGSRVDAGAVIGVLEPTPGHCHPAGCLHWGLRVGEEYRDPLTLLGPRRVRLLPLLER